MTTEPTTQPRALPDINGDVFTVHLDQWHIPHEALEALGYILSELEYTTNPTGIEQDVREALDHTGLTLTQNPEHPEQFVIGGRYHGDAGELRDILNVLSDFMPEGAGVVYTYEDGTTVAARITNSQFQPVPLTFTY